MNPTGGRDRLHFAHLPTPLESMDQFGRYLGGPHLFIKRDDSTGLAAGGSAARKLEFLMADAVAKRSSVVITQGDTTSSHALQTAAIASKLNIKCVLALQTNRPKSEYSLCHESNAVRLDRLYGAEIRYFPAGANMDAATLDLAADHEALGQASYIIPRGGSNPIGILGYVNCAFEIASQIKEQGLRIDCVIHATDSGATQAGLILGLSLAGVRSPVLGIGIAPRMSDQEERIYALVRQTSEYLGLEQMPARNEIVVNCDYCSDEDGSPTEGALNAVATVAQYESLLLEPMHTGKAMEALIDLIAHKHQFGKDENILFLHTSGHVELFEYMPQVANFLASRSQQS